MRHSYFNLQSQILLNIWHKWFLDFETAKTVEGAKS